MMFTYFLLIVTHIILYCLSIAIKQWFISDSANIRASLGDIPHPLVRVLLRHQTLQALDLQPRKVEVRDLEGQIDRPRLFHGLGWGGVGQGDLGHHRVLSIPWHLANRPLNRVSWLVVVHLLIALVLDDLWVDAGDFFGHIVLDYHVGSHRILGEGCLELNRKQATFMRRTTLYGDSVSKKG